MKKKIFKKLLAFTATAIFAVGAISSHGYYVETNEELLGEAIFNLDVEDEDAFTAEFVTMNESSIVDAAEAGVPAASAHGKVIKANAVSASKDWLQSNHKAIGTKSNIPEEDELAALKRVAFSVDILLDSTWTSSAQLVLFPRDVKKNAAGTYSDGNNSRMINFAYDAHPLRDGTETSKALEAFAPDYDDEGNIVYYRIAEIEPKQWYTFTILYDITDGDNPKLWVWIGDELVADEFGYHRAGGNTGSITEFISGLRVQNTGTNAGAYFDNFQMWKDVQVDEFLATFKNDDPSDDAIKTYDGYHGNYSVTAEEGIASLDFELVSYMDTTRDVVALAMAYDKRTNTVKRVYYKPVTLNMAQEVSGTIENIALPEDYSADNYEIKLYIWNRNDIFAPVFFPVAE